MNKLKIIVISLISCGVFSLILSVIAYFYWIHSYLPEASTIRDISLSEPMKIYSKEGLLISQIGIRKRSIIEYDEVPQLLTESLLVIEDNRFYDHFGVDFLGLVRAFIELVKTGEKTQGASTLTMQLARNLFLTREKSFLRKFREIFLAFKLERIFEKNEILTLYINRVFLGHRSYGFQAAAQTYFGKPLDELSLAELALLAGLPKAPSVFNPISNPSRAKIRRNYILFRLKQNGIIDEQTYKIAVSTPLKVQKHSIPVDVNAGHIAEMAQRKAISILQKKGITDGLYEKGYKVFTTIVGKNQQSATKAVQQGVLNYIRRYKWGGVEKKVKINTSSDSTTWDKRTLEQKRNFLEDKKSVNYLISLSQEIEFIDGLVRSIIYHSKDNQILALTEDGDFIELRKKDISWAKKTWTRETSKNRKLKLLSQEIKQDIDAILEDDNEGIYFVPHLEPINKTIARQNKPLPEGGLIYVKEQKSKQSTNTFTLYAKPKVQSALVSIDVRTGAIISLVGGFNYHNYKFNRATQSKRQPGSSFKPFLYAAALDKGMTVATVIDDIPISFEDKSTGFIWTPNNYSNKYYGPTRLRDALTYSRNLVSVKILTNIGLPYTINYMNKFGFDRKPFTQNRNLSISLGSAPLSPLSLTRGYAVFANGGYLVDPYLISEIQDGEGNTIYRYDPPVICSENCEQKKAQHSINSVATPISNATTAPTKTFTQTLDGDISYIITDLLQGVIQRGTGRRAKVLKRTDLAGKTGTTNDQYDAWFSGYNHSIATTVWVGYDAPKTMGERETGGRAALPIWIQYMREALKDNPVIKFPRSTNIVEVRISKATGQPIRNDNEKSVLEIFRSQYAPSIQSNQPNQPPSLNINSEDFNDITDQLNEEGDATPKVQKNLIKELF